MIVSLVIQKQVGKFPMTGKQSFLEHPPENQVHQLPIRISRLVDPIFRFRIQNTHRQNIRECL